MLEEKVNAQLAGECLLESARGEVPSGEGVVLSTPAGVVVVPAAAPQLVVSQTQVTIIG